MGKKQKQRQRQVDHGGVFYYHPPWRTRAASKAPSAIPWCHTHARRFEGAWRAEASIERKVRCPDCGRRLQLMTVDIEQGHGDFWPYIPPHKIRKLAARTRVKKVSRGSKGFIR